MNNQFLNKPWWDKRSDSNNPNLTLYTGLNNLSAVENTPPDNNHWHLGYVGRLAVPLTALLLYLATALMEFIIIFNVP